MATTSRVEAEKAALNPKAEVIGNYGQYRLIKHEGKFYAVSFALREDNSQVIDDAMRLNLSKVQPWKSEKEKAHEALLQTLAKRRKYEDERLRTKERSRLEG